MFKGVDSGGLHAVLNSTPSHDAGVVMSSPTVMPGVSPGSQLSVSWTVLLTCPKHILVATVLPRGYESVGPLFVGVSITL